MNFLCPACRTPLPAAAGQGVVPCGQCGVEVDLTRVDTAPGTARLWPDVDLSGEQLGGHRLRSRIAAGGMGVVYEADGPGGRCAVKVLSALLAAEPELRRRFRREAAALRAIDHPGVVRVFSEGEERGFCFYAMERVDGEDLRARLERGPLPAAEVERLARSLLTTLAEVHAKGFVHRDLKPGNVLLTPSGPRLCDFGIARFDGSSTLTESAAVLGSLRYMAPEQRLGKATALSDLYALGILLHEALAGGVPGERDLPASTPGKLRRAIAALTAERPEHRPMDARRALALLERSRARPATLAAAGAAALALAASVGGARLIAPSAKPLQESSAARREPPLPEARPAPQEPQAPAAPPTARPTQPADSKNRSPEPEEAGMEAAPALALKELGSKAPPTKGPRSRAVPKTVVDSFSAGAITADAKDVAEPATSPEIPEISNQAQQVEMRQQAPSKAKPWRKTSVKQVELEPAPASKSSP